MQFRAVKRGIACFMVLCMAMVFVPVQAWAADGAGESDQSTLVGDVTPEEGQEAPDAEPDASDGSVPAPADSSVPEMEDGDSSADGVADVSDSSGADVPEEEAPEAESEVAVDSSVAEPVPESEVPVDSSVVEPMPESEAAVDSSAVEPAPEETDEDAAEVRPEEDAAVFSVGVEHNTLPRYGVEAGKEHTTAAYVQLTAETTETVYVQAFTENAESGAIPVGEAVAAEKQGDTDYVAALTLPANTGDWAMSYRIMAKVGDGAYSDNRGYNIYVAVNNSVIGYLYPDRYSLPVYDSETGEEDYRVRLYVPQAEMAGATVYLQAFTHHSAQGTVPHGEPLAMRYDAEAGAYMGDMTLPRMSGGQTGMVSYTFRVRIDEGAYSTASTCTNVYGSVIQSIYPSHYGLPTYDSGTGGEDYSVQIRVPLTELTGRTVYLQAFTLDSMQQTETPYGQPMAMSYDSQEGAYVTELTLPKVNGGQEVYYRFRARIDAGDYSSVGCTVVVRPTVIGWVSADVWQLPNINAPQGEEWQVNVRVNAPEFTHGEKVYVQLFKESTDIAVGEPVEAEWTQDGGVGHYRATVNAPPCYGQTPTYYTVKAAVKVGETMGVFTGTSTIWLTQLSVSVSSYTLPNRDAEPGREMELSVFMDAWGMELSETVYVQAYAQDGPKSAWTEAVYTEVDGAMVYRADLMPDYYFGSYHTIYSLRVKVGEQLYSDGYVSITVFPVPAEVEAVHPDLPRYDVAEGEAYTTDILVHLPAKADKRVYLKVYDDEDLMETIEAIYSENRGCYVATYTFPHFQEEYIYEDIYHIGVIFEGMAPGDVGIAYTSVFVHDSYIYAVKAVPSALPHKSVGHPEEYTTTIQVKAPLMEGVRIWLQATYWTIPVWEPVLATYDASVGAYTAKMTFPPSPDGDWMGYTVKARIDDGPYAAAYARVSIYNSHVRDIYSDYSLPWENAEDGIEYTAEVTAIVGNEYTGAVYMQAYKDGVPFGGEVRAEKDQYPYGENAYSAVFEFPPNPGGAPVGYVVKARVENESYNHDGAEISVHDSMIYSVSALNALLPKKSSTTTEKAHTTTIQTYRGSKSNTYPYVQVFLGDEAVSELMEMPRRTMSYTFPTNTGSEPLVYTVRAKETPDGDFVYASCEVTVRPQSVVYISANKTTFVTPPTGGGGHALELTVETTAVYGDTAVSVEIFKDGALFTRPLAASRARQNVYTASCVLPDNDGDEAAVYTVKVRIGERDFDAVTRDIVVEPAPCVRAEWLVLAPVVYNGERQVPQIDYIYAEQDPDGIGAIEVVGYRGESFEGVAYDAAEAPIDAGLYTITLNIGQGAYCRETLGLELPYHLEAARITFVAHDKQMAMGGEVPKFTWDMTGDTLGREMTEILEGTVQFVSSVNVNVPGRYWIEPTDVSLNFLDKNFKFGFVRGRLVVQGTAVACVVLSQRTLTLTEGQAATLVATVQPADATDKTLVWSSSAPAVATVDQTGKVTALGAGSAVITVSSWDGAQTDRCTVTVKAATVAVSGVVLSQRTLALTEGQAATLVATVQPADASNKALSWTSSAPAVATVDQSGKVTALGAGDVVITVTTADGGKTDRCTVSVEAATVAVNGVVLAHRDEVLEGGDSLQLVATVQPAGASNKALSWTSSAPAVAAVDQSGLVTALGAGDAVITVTTADGAYTATVALHVVAPVTEVKMALGALYLVRGKEITVKAEAYTKDGSDAALSWSSENTKVATVTDSGRIKGVGKGKTTITAEAENGEKAKLTVNVVEKNKAVKVKKVAVTGAPKKLEAGQTKALKVNITPKNATGVTVKWSTSNKKVLLVDVAGTLTAVGEGTAKITLSAGGQKGSVSVQVHAPVDKISFAEKPGTLKARGKLTLKPEVEMKWAYDGKVALVWTSAKPKVATVSGKGKVAAKAKGSTKITVKARNGAKASVNIKVK